MIVCNNKNDTRIARMNVMYQFPCYTEYKNKVLFLYKCFGALRLLNNTSVTILFADLFSIRTSLI